MPHLNSFGQFRISTKIGIGVISILLLATLVALGSTYNVERSRLDALVHDKAARILLALESSHTQAMTHRGDKKDNNPVLDAFNGTVEDLSSTQNLMDIWLIMSPKVLDYQRRAGSNEIEPPIDEVDREAMSSLQPVGRYISETMYRYTVPIVLGQGSGDNPACFSCHGRDMGIVAGEAIGGFSVAYNASGDIKNFEDTLSRFALYFMFFAGSIVLLIFIGINRLVSQPIEKIVQLMNGISKSDKGIHIPDPASAKSSEFARMLTSLEYFNEFNKSNYKEIANALSEQKYALDQHTIIATTDIKGTITMVNSKFCELSGYSKEELIGNNHRLLNSGNQPKEYWRNMFLTVSKGGVWNDIVRNRAKDGSFYWVDTTIVPLTSEAILDSKNKRSSKIKGYIAIRTDITEQKQVEEALLMQSQITTNMVEAAFLISRSDGRIIYTNPSFDKILGYMPGEMIGKPASQLYAPTNISPEETTKQIQFGLKMAGKWHGEVCNLKKDGTTIWCSVNISTFDHPVYGEVWVSVNSDSTERRQAEQKLSYQASHDSLTGLINRYEFERRVERLIASLQTNPGEHALCFMDLDQFKVVNDSCGHNAGDELLRQLGNVLKQSGRQRDTVARLGGDEFGVLMEHCSLDQAQWAVTALKEAIQDFHFIWQKQSFRVGVSIGLVSINQSTASVMDLLKQADAACYMAKDLGRNRIHTYQPEDSELLLRHGEMQWVARINDALENNLFTLYAQSIEPLDDSGDKHYELLVRMIDDNGDIIPPGAFLPAAERYDLVSKLDSWIIEQAFKTMADNPVFVAQVSFISINLSGQSITDGSFLQSIIEKIDLYKIDPSKICFEITETAAISNLNAATTFIAILKDMGCHFALDDFGSGLSSFGYLKNLPVDYLKIDGMFVKGMVDDPIDHAMVKSINEIGHVMGMKTIAEFVENDQIKQRLKEIEVDYVQGYGIGKPEPLELLTSRY